FADDGPGHYGLLWWVNAADARSTRRWDGIEPAAFAASGYNNNDLFVLPGLRIVVVRLGLDQDTDGPIPESIYARVLRLLCQAIE
ncbi:MAG TPA: hypothetical protein PKB10_11300, partial [Tepidisphaeraceae bacterium]|nr:hypothetical protein [Tepidisphaeraceae bacterium]